MANGFQQLRALEKHGPLRVMFILTSMPVGGAETLLVNLIRRIDRRRFAPVLCCLKERGPLGEELAAEIPVHCRLLAGKYDLRVLPRLNRLLAAERIDAVVTVGAGDKMFWGRLAARFAGVPVVCSALHSTGWPDGVGRLNRLLTPITDAFIGVAGPHARHLIEIERFPECKVRVVPNGVDTDRFRPLDDASELRQKLSIPPGAPVAGIVAALRPEKNHSLFLETAAGVVRELPDAVFLIVGDGPERPHLEQLARKLGLETHVRLLGNRADVPEILSVLDLFVLTSHNEAHPVSILEAMSCGRPVVATDVGSIHESVRDGRSGYLVPPGDRTALAARMIRLLSDPTLARQFGRCGRTEVLQNWSLERMVSGYEHLLHELYCQKMAAEPSDTPRGAKQEVLGRTACAGFHSETAAVYQTIPCADRIEVSPQ